MSAGVNYRSKLDAEPDLMADQKGVIIEYDKTDHCWDKYPKCSRCCWCLIGTFLFIFAIQATFVPHLLNDAVTNGLQDALIFTSPQPKSANYQTWLTNTFGSNAVPIWMECRFFNVTNKESLLLPPQPGQNHTFPHLHLTDPLIYDEWYLKYNVNFSYHNSSEWVEYQQWQYYTLSEKERYPNNQLSPDDYIVIISPIIGLLYYQWLWPRNDSQLYKFADWELAKILNNLDPNILFWEGTAEEILFNITQIDIPNPLDPDGPPLIKKSLNQGLLGNGSSPNSTTANTTYEVTHTGHNAPHRMGEVLFYGGNTTNPIGWVDCYDTPMQIWPAKDTFFGINNVKKHDQQSIWVNTLFKDIILNYNYSYTWKDNIELYRYTVQMLPQYANASMWPPNKQFNMFGTSGVQNLTSCMTLPIFVSFPEFLGADDFIVNNTKMNLTKNPSWDLLPTVDVEPRTGGIYKANKSLQLNTVIHSLPFNYSLNWNRSRPFNESDIYLDRTEENRAEFGEKSLGWIADDLVVPMIELSECTELPDSQAKSFSNQVIGTTTWAKRLEWIGVGCGCAFALWATLCGFWIAKRDNKKRYVVQ